jgi:hypothetical protein
MQNILKFRLFKTCYAKIYKIVFARQPYMKKRAKITAVIEEQQISEKEYVAQKSAFYIEPLPATFTLTSLLGLIITTVFTISGRIGVSWGISFDLVFLLMFISSMMSITPAEA